MADEFEATASGVLVPINCGNATHEDQELKFLHEDTAEPLTVSQEKERVLSELGQPVANSRWRIKFQFDPPVEMEDSFPIKNYVHDLTNCTVIETYYL